VHVQPSRKWLAANADRRYLDNLNASSRPRDREAARRLEQVIARQDQFDAGIVNVRPANGKAYGRGIDTTARLIRGGGGVRRLDIIDVPFR